MVTKTIQTPMINQAAYDMLKEQILRPSAPAITKGFEQLLTDEVKRVVMNAIDMHFKIMP